MNSLVALPIAAAVPTIAPAMPPSNEADPIFAVIDAYRRADAACASAPGEDIPDELGDRWSEAYDVVLQTRPTTPAGLSALTSWARERTVWMHTQGSMWITEHLGTLFSTLDDAARGMSGLSAWSPNSPALAPVMPSELDALWRERMELTRKANAKARQNSDAWESLPEWAKIGPSYINAAGERCGHEVGWPEVAELPELPTGSARKLIRISPHDLKKDFDSYIGTVDDPLNDPGHHTVRATYRRKMKALIARLRQQREEMALRGISELEKELDRMVDQRFDLDEQIKAIEPSSANLVAACAIIEVSFDVRLGETVEEPGEDLRVALMTIRGLRHLLTGAVRETVDLMLDNPAVPLEDLDVMRA